VGPVSVLKCELGLQVRLKHLNTGNVLCEGSIDGSLGSLSGGEDCGGGLLLTFLAFKEIVVDLGGIDTGKIYTGGSGDDVLLVDTAKRDTVGRVRARYQQQARLQCLQAHHALASEAASNENKHSAGFAGSADLGCIAHRRGTLGEHDILGRVVFTNSTDCCLC